MTVDSQQMTVVKGFRDLDVYQRAYSLALGIHKLTLNFPKAEEFALSSQLRRSSKSICAQIAEGHGKSYKSKPEFQRYLSIAIGSADETGVWIDFAKDLSYITDQDHNEICKNLTIICKQLHTLSRTAK